MGKKFELKSGNTVPFKQMGSSPSKSLGAVAKTGAKLGSRAVPYVGWALAAYDVGKLGYYSVKRGSLKEGAKDLGRDYGMEFDNVSDAKKKMKTKVPVDHNVMSFLSPQYKAASTLYEGYKKIKKGKTKEQKINRGKKFLKETFPKEAELYKKIKNKFKGSDSEPITTPKIKTKTKPKSGKPTYEQSYTSKVADKWKDKGGKEAYIKAAKAWNVKNKT